MKKIFSLLLSTVMIFSILSGFSNCAYAAGWMNSSKQIALDTWYSESASTSDYYNTSNTRYYDVFEFYVPVKGTVTFKIKSENELYVISYWEETGISVSAANDTSNNVFEKWLWYDGYDSAYGYYYQDVAMTLNPGTYYLKISYNSAFVECGDMYGFYDFCLNYSPYIANVSSFKVSNRSASNLTLSWNSIANVNGYQLQMSNGDAYKNVKSTTATSIIVNNLSSATNYSFRIRAYKTVNSKKYYGSWTYLSTPTKPGKVSIKSPSTNSKHQITAKWNKVTRASGYQVQYCKNSSCSNVIATKNVSGQSKTSYTGKNFTKGKKYYVRVRAYKTFNGTKYYGEWSKVKSIKCK